MTPDPLFDPAAALPVLPGHSSRGRLERVLRAGKFAVTAELNPPDSADPREVYERALVLSEVCDAINATDASGANTHMSSVGICSLLTRAGYAVVLQISCRDRNRIAIQGDVLGAAAMGVANILCLTGDGVQAGDQPGAKPVFDLDSTSLLQTIRTMRDDCRFLSGRKITEYCYDVPRLREFMARARDMGLTEKCFILVGVGPLASAKGARWMRGNVPGIHVPDDVIKRLEGAENQKREGKQLCVDLIQEIREIPGVSGVHVMAYRQEELVSEIITDSGIMRNRQARSQGRRVGKEKAAT